MGLLDYFKPPTSNTPFKPGFGQGLGVLAPATNPYIAPPAAPSPAAPTNWAPRPAPTIPRQQYSPVNNSPAIGGGGGGGGPVTEPAKPAPSPADISKMAEVDSTFMDQKSAIANALKKYILDSDRQKGNLERDAGVATDGIERNRTVGLTGLSEDFSARGLGNSGMFRDQLDKADGQYDKQTAGITNSLKDSKNDLAFRRSKYEAENGENGTNIQAARREAYARLAAAQNLT